LFPQVTPYSDLPAEESKTELLNQGKKQTVKETTAKTDT
jgi:hypothetical protein